MKYKFTQDGDVTVLAFSGNVTGGPDADKLHEEIKSHLEDGSRKFLLDFSKTKWINSTGLGIVAAAHMSVRAAEGRLAICGTNERIAGVFYISRLEQIIETFDDLKTGLAALV
ncbi:STAS domain-containing protein [bacterium]|nr:STAS domain-containing protein [bacterium]